MGRWRRLLATFRTVVELWLLFYIGDWPFRSMKALGRGGSLGDARKLREKMTLPEEQRADSGARRTFMSR